MDESGRTEFEVAECAVDVTGFFDCSFLLELADWVFGLLLWFLF